MNILNELTQTKADLIEALSAIDREKFNTAPFEGSWTVGQITEHLLKGNNVELLYADTEPTTRMPDEKVNAIADVFLNFKLKLTPPESILPSDTHQDKQLMIGRLINVFDQLIDACKKLDLSAICLGWVIPAFGPLTRLEFLWLYNVHTRRHIRQIKNIAVAL